MQHIYIIINKYDDDTEYGAVSCYVQYIHRKNNNFFKYTKNNKYNNKKTAKKMKTEEEVYYSLT